MAKVSEPWSSRQARHLAYISEYTTDIRHVEGINNPVADALCRVLISAVSTGLTSKRWLDVSSKMPARLWPT